MEDLAYLAFWAYNTTVLLHLLRSDKRLAEACETEEVNFLGLLEELINAIHGESSRHRDHSSLITCSLHHSSR